MKTIFATLSLIATSLFVAAPAAAECTNVDPATSACAWLDDPSHQSVSAGRYGVGGVGYYHSEYTFFGQTYESSGAHVYTNGESPAGFNYVAYSSFCMRSGGSCAYQDETVWATTGAGSVAVGFWQGSESRYLCYYGDAVGYDCVPF